MTRQEVYKMAQRAGHRAFKALEISLDWERGDPKAREWVQWWSELEAQQKSE